ncbi:MAG: CRTAC1 family protein, partial [Verrucomicrobia bacterium]|nr:CRTAC1 family protein [Verrucomicrobiota bacterium]
MSSRFSFSQFGVFFYLFTLFGFFLATNGAGYVAVPLNDRDKGGADSLFARIDSADSGVDLKLKFPTDAPFDLLTDQTSGTGVAIGDFDSDGFPDLYFTAYDHGNRLYRNLGGWRFEDVTEISQVTGEGRWCGGASFVDIDDDDDLDLYVCVYGDSNLLYVNRGDGVFVEQAKKFGLDFSGASVMMSFADYDRDGDLDGYLVTHRLKQRPQHLLPKSTREAVDRGILEINQKARRVVVQPGFRDYFELMDKGEGRVELIIAGQRDRLYRNDGQDRFSLVSDAAGIRGFGIGLAASWWDYNADGWPDIYVSNDYKGADQLYRNNGDGSFTDVARQSLPHVPWFSMGSDSADLNNDGFLDFLASDMSGRDHFSQKMGMGEMGKNRWFLIRSNPQQYMRNALFLGTGTERLLESAYLAGLANTDWTWSPKFGDFDLDGREDLFVSNGMSRDFMNSDLSASIRSRDDVKWLETPVLRQSNLAYRNLGDLSFESVEKRWGLDQVSASYGVALSDLDRDGDLDIVHSNFDEAVSIYRNRGTDGAALLMRLEGRESNRWGIGCKVSAEVNGLKMTRVLSSSQGFMSANEPLVHIGFEASESIERLRIEWPSGVIQELIDVETGTFLRIQEPVRQADLVNKTSSESPWFAEEPIGFEWQHRERFFDDYQVQPLLPSRQSQSGSGIAVGDVDGDGDEDLYLGGAAGQSG